MGSLVLGRQTVRLLTKLNSHHQHPAGTLPSAPACSPLTQAFHQAILFSSQSPFPREMKTHSSALPLLRDSPGLAPSRAGQVLGVGCWVWWRKQAPGPTPCPLGSAWLWVPPGAPWPHPGTARSLPVEFCHSLPNVWAVAVV